MNSTVEGDKYAPCRCCGWCVLPFVGGSYPDLRICDDCGRGKCDDCIEDMRRLWRANG